MKSHPHSRWRDDPKLRMAVHLTAQLERYPGLSTLEQAMDRVVSRISALQSTWRQLQLAASRQWTLSARILQQRLSDQLVDLRNYCNHPQAGLQESQHRVSVKTRTIHEELVACQEQFNQFSIEKAIVSVVTDPIELEGNNLGRFRIEIDTSRCSNHQPLHGIQTIALDPNPAANDESITHPHVRDDLLCLGEASVPLFHALEDGRLFDAFQLIDRMLHTYNEGSAYLTLEDWNGRTCEECGRSSSEEDMSYCERCGNGLCSRCQVVCDHCGNPYCFSHTDELGDERLCSRCYDQAIEAQAEEQEEEQGQEQQQEIIDDPQEQAA